MLLPKALFCPGQLICGRNSWNESKACRQRDGDDRTKARGSACPHSRNVHARSREEVAHTVLRLAQRPVARRLREFGSIFRFQGRISPKRPNHDSYGLAHIQLLESRGLIEGGRHKPLCAIWPNWHRWRIRFPNVDSQGKRSPYLILRKEGSSIPAYLFSIGTRCSRLGDENETA